MSAFFDPADKKNKPILDFFESKSWLVCEISSSTRTSIKKTIVQLGSKMNNMHDADTFSAALEIIEIHRPHFIICNKNISGGNIAELFAAHVKFWPNRLMSGFFVIADESDANEVALALDYEMDGIIAQPFTGFTIIDTLIKGIKLKLNPTPYLTKIEEGRFNYIIGDLEHAMEDFQNALNLSKNPYEGHYFIGQIYSDTNHPEKAIVSMEKSLSYNPDYFKALNRLSMLYYQQQDFKKAYSINKQMAQKYPTNPERIPELIRLSIINQHYEDIYNYLQMFNSESASNVKARSYLSAGLVILGKHFINSNEVDKGVEALKTAFKYSNGKFEILKSITQAFQESHHLDILYSMFEETDMSEWPANSQILYFHTMHSMSKDDLYVVTLGEKLLKSNIKDIMVYRGLMERALRMKRSSTYIENLFNEIAKNFPQHEEEFKSLIQKYK